MARKQPTGLTICAYQVGFGDCFLLSFEYPDRPRHVLIDFGSTGLPKGTPRSHMLDVAKDIEQRTGGKLDAVVATHRHKDHISGFATRKGKAIGTGDIIRSLSPDVVVQPWTEDPKAKTDAKKATRLVERNSHEKSLLHVAALAHMEDVAASVVERTRRMRRALDYEVADEITFIGDDNLSNLSAVKNLMTMGTKNYYVHFGSRSGLESVLPGVKVHVLGPPTLEQTATIGKERSKDPEEFWQFWGHQAAAAESVADQKQKPLFPRFAEAQVPPSLRWFRQRLTEVHADSMLQLVRILDDAMNNTSVILLFEVGGQKLLFPGDAQIENWAYALSKKSVQNLLKGVNLYKVGHHGSLNATPRHSLWPLFEHKGAKAGERRLKTVVSTMAGKHGHVDRGTEVPRSKLVQELKAETNFFTTQELAGKASEPHETTISFGRRRK